MQVTEHSPANYHTLYSILFFPKFVNLKGRFFMEFSSFLQALVPIALLSCILTAAGSLWIDHLYGKSTEDLLSFPEQMAIRARFRKPLLFALLAFCFWKAWALPIATATLLFLIVIISALAFVTITDFEQYVIFDAMLLPLAVVGLGYVVQMHLPLGQHIAAALGGGCLFFLLTVLTRGAIGGGDIKLIAVLGLWLGIRPLVQVIAYGLLAGGAAALIMLLAKQKNRHSYFAYGPYFALSAIGILLGWLPF